jgi:8-oxo-dGTP diphosphatase
MTDHKQYVVGFLFAPDLATDTCVALTQKNHPPWQAGKLNGIGGHIEPGETPHEAMVREFEEEAGLIVPKWFPVLTMEGPDYTLHVFMAVAREHLIKSKTDEPVGFYPLRSLACYDVVPDLRWFIPLMLHFDNGRYNHFTMMVDQ